MPGTISSNPIIIRVSFTIKNFNVNYLIHSLRLATLTQRFVENEPLWKPCLWKVEYIHECILLSTNMVSTMARFPQISRLGMPDILTRILFCQQNRNILNLFFFNNPHLNEVLLNNVIQNCEVNNDPIHIIVDDKVNS